MTVFQFLIQPLSDMEIATIAGLKSTRVVSKWRDGTGKPNADRLLIFAKHFNKSIEELLSQRTKKGKQ